MAFDLDTALTSIYGAAIEAVDPGEAVRRYFKEADPDFSGFRKIFLSGFGKAGYPMAQAVEKQLGDRLSRGIIIVKDGHGGRLNRTKVLEASHPEPDERGRKGAEAMIQMLSAETGPEDLVIIVISGGGSALLPLPAEGISLEDKQNTTRALLSCGAEIQEINAIRKHISGVKGGRLLRALNGASVLSLILSDVIGDDLASIASGPTAADPTTYRDCLDIIEKYGIESSIPPPVMNHLERGAAGGKESPPETLKPGEFSPERIKNIIIANNRQAMEAAGTEARRMGYTPLILSSSLSGDTGELARFHVALAREILSSGKPVTPPCCLISGGESTVRLKGDGKGGRNMEFTLECARHMNHFSGKPVMFASLGTDGTDGPTDSAGARVTHSTLAKARELGLSVEDHLRRNDSYNFFHPLGDLIITGPTRTNVMDLHFVLIG